MAGEDMAARCRATLRVNLFDFAIDKVPIGDGVLRRLPAAVVAQKARYGLTGETVFDDLDADDTYDYLAFARAILHLAQQGGGILEVPDPAMRGIRPGEGGSGRLEYTIQRCLPHIRDGVRIVGTGDAPDKVRVRNRFDIEGRSGFEQLLRGNVTMFGSTHPVAFNELNAQRAASVSLAGSPVEAGAMAVALADAGDGGKLRPGQVVWVCDVSDHILSGDGNVPERSAWIYKFCLPNIVRTVQGGRVELAYPLPYAIGAGQGRLYLAGTGTLSVGRGPHRMPRGIGLENLTLVSDTKHCMAETGAIDSYIRDVKGESAWGFMLTNCLAYSIIENVEARFGIGTGAGFGANGLEIKGGCCGLALRNVDLICEKEAEGTRQQEKGYPNFSIGENAVDCVIDGLRIESRNTYNPALFLQFRNLEVRGLKAWSNRKGAVVAIIRRGDGKNRLLGDMEFKGQNWELSGDGIGAWLWVNADGQNVDHIELDGIDCTGRANGMGFWVDGPVKGGWVADVSLPRGFTIDRQGNPTQVRNMAALSRVKGAYAAAAPAFADPASWANAALKERGRPVLVTDGPDAGRRFAHDGRDWRCDDRDAVHPDPHREGSLIDMRGHARRMVELAAPGGIGRIVGGPPGGLVQLAFAASGSRLRHSQDLQLAHGRDWLPMAGDLLSLAVDADGQARREVHRDSFIVPSSRNADLMALRDVRDPLNLGAKQASRPVILADGRLAVPLAAGQAYAAWRLPDQDRLVLPGIDLTTGWDWRRTAGGWQGSPAGGGHLPGYVPRGIVLGDAFLMEQAGSGRDIRPGMWSFGGQNMAGYRTLMLRLPWRSLSGRIRGTPLAGEPLILPDGAPARLVRAGPARLVVEGLADGPAPRSLFGGSSGFAFGLDEDEGQTSPLHLAPAALGARRSFLDIRQV